MSEPGRLEAIWIKRFKRGPMDPSEEATLVSGRGIDGNANQGGKRQVTIISREAWQELVADAGGEADPASRRANFMVSGVELEQTRGRVLAIGGVRVLIHGETRPCERMDEGALPLKGAMASGWRGGVYGEVLDDGRVRVGDEVAWRES